jgi:tetratricopeptide (TPR) repeat protein
MPRQGVALIIALVGSLLWLEVVCAQQATTDIKKEMQDKIDILKGEVQSEQKKLSEALEGVKKDQINYRLDRDLLKDYFGAHLYTIQIVLLIASGIIALIAGLGLANIRELRDKYDREFRKLRNLRRSWQKVLQKLSQDYKKIQQKNLDQDQRLAEIECILQGESYLARGDYRLALRWAQPALEKYPRSTAVWYRKGTAHVRAAEYEEASEAFRRLLEVNPEHEDAVLALAEVSLMAGRIDTYEQTIKRFQKIIQRVDDAESGRFIAYLDVLKLYILKDLEGMKDRIRRSVQRLKPPENLEHMFWSFNDLYTFLSGTGALATPEGNLLSDFTNFLQAGERTEGFITALEQPADNGQTAP